MNVWHSVYTLSSKWECVDGNKQTYSRRDQSIFTWSQCKHSEQDRVTKREIGYFKYIVYFAFECVCVFLLTHFLREDSLSDSLILFFSLLERLTPQLLLQSWHPRLQYTPEFNHQSLLIGGTPS